MLWDLLCSLGVSFKRNRRIHPHDKLELYTPFANRNGPKSTKTIFNKYKNKQNHETQNCESFVYAHGGRAKVVENKCVCSFSDFFRSGPGARPVSPKILILGCPGCPKCPPNDTKPLQKGGLQNPSKFLKKIIKKHRKQKCVSFV